MDSSTTNRECYPKIEIIDQKLWSQFHQHTTEMVITRSGRRLFPFINLRISGLDPTSMYIVMMDIVSVDSFRYKFQNGKWLALNGADPDHIRLPCIHPKSPATGTVWMDEGADFRNLKLTNGRKQCGDNTFILNSMQRYQPRFHIIRCRDGHNKSPMIKTFTSKDTDFIAVTSYQNPEVTRMKILNNPFAKAFTVKKTLKIGIYEDCSSLEDAKPTRKRSETTYDSPEIFEDNVSPMSLPPIFAHLQNSLFTPRESPKKSKFLEKPKIRTGFHIIDLLGV